jgi:hypothetical protein
LLTRIIRNQGANPVIPYILDTLRIGIEIGQGHGGVTQPAVLHISLVAIVCDLAVGMKIIIRVEGVKDAVINTGASTLVALMMSVNKYFSASAALFKTHHVVGNNIDHEVHATIMESRCQRLEVTSCPIV